MGVRYVLDTCALLSLGGMVDKALSSLTRQRLNQADALMVSPISLYEMGVKWKKGLLVLSPDPEFFWEQSIKVYDLSPVPIEAAVLAKAYNLPDIHRDPFDRIIIAQAMLLAVPVVTFDPVFAAYGIRTVC